MRIRGEIGQALLCAVVCSGCATVIEIGIPAHNEAVECVEELWSWGAEEHGNLWPEAGVRSQHRHRRVLGRGLRAGLGGPGAHSGGHYRAFPTQELRGKRTLQWYTPRSNSRCLPSDRSAPLEF